jgi:hypothetical protein
MAPMVFPNNPDEVDDEDFKDWIDKVHGLCM